MKTLAEITIEENARLAENVTSILVALLNDADNGLRISKEIRERVRAALSQAELLSKNLRYEASR